MDGQYYRDLLRPVYGNGKRWVVAVDVLAAAPLTVEILHEYGAARSLVLAGSRGTGDVPDEAHAESILLGTSGDTVMQAFRAFDAAIAQPPGEVQARIDAWDSDGSARALVWFTTSEHPVGGRKPFGARRPAWLALEDKMTADALWGDAGVARAPAEHVPADLDALWSAAGRLDRGSGTVWAGDNKEGWHGGAEYVRWVRTAEDAADAASFLFQHCDRARVMPFLDGIPCSTHAMVFPETVLTFNPVEMVIFRTPGSNRLTYAGVSTFWAPDPSVRAEMRDVARKVGEHLRERLGYRGALGIDGVVAEEGFRPTELNPRMSVGLGAQFGAVEHLAGAMLNRAIVAGCDLEYRPAELERMVVEAGIEKKRGGGHIVVPVQQEESVEHDVVFDGAAWRIAAADEDHDGTISFGPGPTGGFVSVRLVPERTPMGESVAPRVIAALRLADELWGLGLGVLEAARPVR